MQKNIIIGFVVAAIMLMVAYDANAGMWGRMDEPDDGAPPMQGFEQRAAGMRGPDEMRGPGHNLWANLEGLGLDGAQKQKIEAITGRLRKDNIRKAADARIARIELRAILDKDPVDIKAAESKLKHSESLMTDMRLSRIRAMEEIKAQLTSEQRKKFREDFGGQAARMRDGIGMRHSRGRGFSGTMGGLCPGKP